MMITEYMKKNFFLIIPLCASAAFFPSFVRYATLCGLGITEILKLGIGITFLLALYVFGVAVFANKSLPIADAGLIFAISFYIISAFSSIIYIHDFVRTDANSSYIYLLVFICAWVTDSFAYFSGRFFGKHKLIPKVSPKKTVEGLTDLLAFL